MAKQKPSAVPDGLRASPTGRVPQWVLDEAAGKPVTPVPFRGATSGLPGGGLPGGKRRRRSGVGVLSLVVLVLGGVVYALYAADPSRFATSAPQAAARTDDRNGPTPGRDEARKPLGVPPPLPAAAEGAGFRFLSHQPDGTSPVTWSPCRPVRFVTRVDNAPIGGAAMIKSALEIVSAATGLTLEDGGFTTEGPSEDRSPYQPQRYGDRWAPVLIAWATPAEVPDFGVDIAGEASPAGVRTPTGDEAYVSGAIYLDAAKIDQARLLYGEPVARSVVLHELAHLVGLAHIDDPKAIMFPRARADVSELSAGDRAGLAALGRGACQPDV